MSKGDLCSVSSGNGNGGRTVNLDFVIRSADNVGPAYGVLCIGESKILGKVACSNLGAELGASVSLNSLNGNCIFSISCKSKSREVKGRGLDSIGVVANLNYVARSSFNCIPRKYGAVKRKTCGNGNDFGNDCGSCGGDCVGGYNRVTFFADFILLTVFGISSFFNYYPFGLRMRTDFFVAT